MFAIGRGRVDLALHANGNTQKCCLTDVLFLPDLQHSLISTDVLVSKNLNFHLIAMQQKVRKYGKIISVGRREGELFSFHSFCSPQSLQTACSTNLKPGMKDLGTYFIQEY